MVRKFAVALVLVMTSISTLTSYAEVAVGDTAPNFTLQGSDGATHTLTEMRGKYVVVAFFPKAYTKG